MSNRNVALAVCLCIASWTALGQGSRYVIELSGGKLFDGFSADANSTTPAFDDSADSNPPGAVEQVIAKPDGSQFYIIGANGVQSATPSFSASSFTTISGISGSPTAAALSPDGKYLYIGATGLYIVNTSTNTVVPNSVPTNGAYIAGIVFSSDSQRAYILTNAATGSSISQVSVANQSLVGQPLALPNGCATSSSSTPLIINGVSIPLGGPVCSMTISPEQLIYVSNGYAVYEINPITMALTTGGTIQTNTSTIGPLRFTPDGSTAYGVNLTPAIAGRSMVQINLGTHAISELNFANILSQGPPVFTDVLPVSATRIFAYTSSSTSQPNPTTLYDITPTPFNAIPDTSPGTSLPGVPATTLSNVLSAVISNEQPSAAYLYLLVANGATQTNLEKISLANNTVGLQALAPLGPGTLEFVSVPPQTGVASFIQFNNGQTVNAGATSGALAAVLVNSAGIPVYNVPVTFSAGSSGITVNTPTPTSNDVGYVQTNVTIPSTLAGGAYTITMSGGGLSASFTVNVPGSGTTTTSPTGAVQVSIVSGNGMLIYSTYGPVCETTPVLYLQSSTVPGSYAGTCPLTIQVTGTNGAPLANEPVTFTISSGPGGLTYSDNTTDSNGLASAVFFPQTSFFGMADFEATVINASTPVGAVNFTETTVDSSNPTGLFRPEIDLIAPGPPYIINAGEGDTIPNAIQYQIVGTGSIQQLAPIPNVAIRLSVATDTVTPGPASCVGNNLSSSTGVASCNMLVSCHYGTGPQRIGVNIDGIGFFDSRITLNIVPGTSQTLNLLSGNNQSGNVGKTLGQALVATVTDNCGSPIPGVQVTWQVTSGSATLSNTVSVSNLSGQVSTQLVLGQVPGPVQVTASIGTATTVTFSETNNVTVGSLTLTSGGGQTAVENQAFAQPLVFTVKDSNNNPVQGVQVNFTISSGSLVLSATSAVTNSSGQASITVTGGTSPGPATVQAAYATFTASATLTVQAPGPVLTSSSFTNNASGKPGLVPCGLTTATGSGLVASANEFVPGNSLVSLNLPLPYTLAGISISVNSVPAPIDFVSSSNGVQEVVFQTPCETAPGTATVAVTTNAGTATAATTTNTVTVSAAQPGIFTYAGPAAVTYGYVLDVNGNAIGPSNLAQPGGTYFLVATGLGQTTPRAITNAGGNGSETVPVSQVIVGIDNEGVPVLSVQYVAIGVYYVEFQLPATTCVSNNQPQPCSPVGTNVPLALAEIVNGQAVYDGEYSYLAGVQ